MKRIGNESIWFTGKRKAITRVLYQDHDGKHYVKWHNQLIEVAPDYTGYYATVETH